MSEQTQDKVAIRLEVARKELLDLGLRNPLLNYRPMRSRGLEVVDERPEEVFRRLVVERKAMTFLHNPEHLPAPESRSEQLDEDAPSDDVIQREGEAEASAVAARHVDSRLQTALPSTPLQARLLATYYMARTFIEERGANVLYLALGMLHWYEADTSEELRRAPLLLIPVELTRSMARERFELRYTEDEIGANLSLAAKLAAEFGLAIPPLPALEDLDSAAYFRGVAEAVSDQQRWSVDDTAIVLGLFSFGKFLMYRDLDPGTWPAGSAPDQHPLVRALLQDGFREAAPRLTEDDFLDRHVPPHELHQVVDADSSQTLAILAAKEGRNLVIQGPPGTGKSQTITNMIAEAIADGKRVLFVAEKMAALEVVKRRLDSVGLGDACLELHSHKGQKKALLAALQGTLQRDPPRGAGLAVALSALGEARDRLTTYADAVNTPVGASGVRPHDAFGALLRLREGDTAIPRLDMPFVAGWTAAEFARHDGLVEQLAARLERLGPPREHHFWGSRRLVFLPTERERLGATVEAAHRATLHLVRAATALATSLAYAVPDFRADAAALCGWVRHALASPDVAGVPLDAGGWRTRRDDLDRLLAAGRAFRDAHANHDDALIPEAWDDDLLETRQDLAAYGGKWWRFCSGTYRRARRRLAGLCRDGLPADREDQLALIDGILAARSGRAVIRDHEALGGRLFGPHWRGASSDWDALGRIADWVRALHEAVGAGPLPASLIAFLHRVPAIAGAAATSGAVEEALAAQERALRAAVAALELDEEARFGAGATLAQQPFGAQEAILRDWGCRLDDLHDLVAFNVALAACRREELTPLVTAALTGEHGGATLLAAFRRTWFETILERAYAERPPLADFDGQGHDHAVDKFRELDTLTFTQHRATLALAHRGRLPQGDGAGQLGVLRREFEKRARHLPIRQLLTLAGNAIQAIKPVFMMSPLSIATFLAPGGVAFDLVIFDEASQVKPVEALGAILRGKQVVVVGDSKQLPPTSFFDALVAEEPADEDDVTSDIESILGLFAAQGAPSRMLRWHYRSRHESLIAVSNHLFYDDRLIVFPSPDAARTHAGLVYRHLPDTAYDRGRTASNPREAEAVARAVMAHARREPGLTLGVAAFSVAQQKAVQDQLEILRRRDPSAESFFAAHPHEPFFVKNLETIQGDERDVILISIGYGRTAEGYLAMNFGPLNGKHGERRLNVLITRARLRCEVFTNLSADDIDLHRSDAVGVRALKTFLTYAQRGVLDVPQVTGRGFDSPFEESVARALIAQGYRLESQIGSAGFFVDLAVVDPQQPGRYVLGIECDGATYHSARSARDRDRLRQAVLEGLGWRIHRIWSTDWFRHPERELRRTVAAIEGAKVWVPPSAPPQAKDETTAPTGGGNTAPTGAEERIVPHDPAPDAATSGAPPAYAVARLAPLPRGTALHELPTAMLASRVMEVVSIEGPVHVSEVIRRIADAAGVSRAGNRIRAAIETAADQAARSGRIRRAGTFLWLSAMEQAPLRDRSALTPTSRRLELVAPEEIARAVERVVTESYGIDAAAIPPLACRLLGFQRTTEEMRGHVAPIVESLMASGRLARQGDYVVTGT